ncbi:MAG TPA: protein kinase [Ignavibacteriaceae bacterium]|nr:protein kinase [Ignavibacteriaceae bacterium]
MTGKTISHYKILKKLGEGGMGVVYLAEDSKLERKVAIKFLPGHIAEKTEERERFKTEAKAAAALNHPKITTIYAIEETNDRMYIVMEYIDGIELKDRIRSGPISVEETIKIAVQIAEGLEAAHKKGIVHRDIKSQNIMITTDGKIKVMDFGLAKVGKGTQLTKVGSTVGTVASMSPEQVRGEDVDQRADIWSFGVVLYEMLTGELPFKGEYEASAIYEILNVDPKPVSSFRKDIPENLNILISKMLQKDVMKRISSTGEILKILNSKQFEYNVSRAEKSIAVLYFENMSPEKENEYFCAGITEDIIIDLSKIKEIKVIPRADVFSFRSKEVNSAKVGEILGVTHVLKGSVRKSGQQIRVTAQLIDMQSGYPIWAERYDRLLENIFEVQIEISQKIAEALKVSLSDSEKESLAQKPTDDLRAHDFYMRGRDYFNAGGKTNNESAIKMFEQAIAIDPNYSLVYVSLAEAYSFQYIFYDGDQKWLGLVITASEKAKELDPNLLEVEVTKGIVLFHQKRFDEAKRTFLKFIQKKDDYYPAYFWLGSTEMITNENEKALKHFERAAEIKPYSEEPWVHIDLVYRKMGNTSASKIAAEKMIEAIKKKVENNAQDGIAYSRAAAYYAVSGDRTSALEIINKVMEISPNDGLALYNCACTYAQLGQKDKSMEFLKKALATGYKNIIEWIENDPDFESLRSDSEFKEILNSANG